MCRVLVQELGVVQAQRTSSNQLGPQQNSASKVCIGLPHAFGVVQLYRTVTNNSFPGERSVQGASALVQAYRTSSNLLEPQHRRESKVCRVLSPEFGVVQLYRTVANKHFTGEARCAGCLSTRSGWFTYGEPPRPTAAQREQGV